MNNQRVRIIGFFAFIMTAVSVAPTWAEGGSGTWGAKAAAADGERSVEDMLRYAIQDEYLARAEYLAIMKKHGNIKPFSNIVGSEESHISWLKEAYASAKLPIPSDTATLYVVVPDTLKAAFEAGVAAEVDNIAMYDSFIASAIMAKPENASLKALFVRLRDASKNHLSAFRNGLSK